MAMCDGGPHVSVFSFKFVLQAAEGWHSRWMGMGTCNYFWFSCCNSPVRGAALPGDGAESLLLVARHALVQLHHGGPAAGNHHGGGELTTHAGGVNVVVPGVGNVRLEALDGSHATDGGLGGEAQEGEHGEAAVLQLLHLGLVGLHAHGVEGEGAQEAALAGLLPPVDAPCLQDGHDGDLDANQLQSGQSVLLGACLPPVAEAEGVGEENARDGSHSPAPVHQLSLAVVRQKLLVGTDAQGVEPVVAGHRAIEVSRGLGTRVPGGALGAHDHGSAGGSTGRAGGHGGTASQSGPGGQSSGSGESHGV
mmetsp:Transcript_28772/g.51459  ORF Transcript_28772/g.51459 Transcript_28772/m.51459 type:complete len:307 (-) Transcript_28772:121-1041(-)